MRSLCLALSIITLASCSGDRDRVTGLSQPANAPASSPDGFSASSFYVDTRRATASFRKVEDTENIYIVRLDLFVFNASKISLEDVQATVQIFNSQGTQVGIKFVAGRPQVVPPSTGAWYSVEFTPIHNPYYVTSYRITPLSSRGKGWVTAENVPWQ